MGAALAYPLALGGLALAAALVAVYFLRGRSRPMPVSSLLLWEALGPPILQGVIPRRLRTPLLFFLELAAIVQLVLAAAEPLISGPAAAVTVAILDDSYSMRAGAPESPHAAALEHLRDSCCEPLDLCLFLAGADAAFLGRAVHPGEAWRLLDAWTCRASAAALDKALFLAREIAPGAPVLVLTDHPPPQPPGANIQWLAFGRPHSNLAFQSAARRQVGTVQRILLEAVNFGPRAAAATVAIACPPGGPAALHPLELPPGGRGRIALELPAGAPALEALLPADALPFDDRVVLAPEAAPSVRVRLLLGDPELAWMASLAVAASGLGRIVDRKPDLLLADRPEQAEPGLWRLEFVDRPDALPYAGPFFCDRSHPLAEGLSLAGVIWPGSPAEPLAGAPIISAGNVVLLAESDRGAATTLRMQLCPALSTLCQQPAWPVLIHNLLDWRRNALPGPRQPNVRMDSVIRITLPPDARSAEVRRPDGTTRRMAARAGELLLAPDLPGLYRVQAEGLGWELGCNALGGEGDLRAAATGRWGRWTAPRAGDARFRSLAPAAILAACAAIAAHMQLLARRGAGGRP